MKTVKYAGAMALAMAAIIAAQMGLTGLVGFRTAELLGKIAITALFWYSIVRLFRPGGKALMRREK